MNIVKRCQCYLLFCWWEQWHIVLFDSYLNFCSKVVTVECNGQGFFRDTDVILVLYLYELLF